MTLCVYTHKPSIPQYINVKLKKLVTALIDDLFTQPQMKIPFVN